MPPPIYAFRRWLGWLVLFALVLGGGYWLTHLPPPLARIKVVDASGRPIAGAVLQPDGLRPKSNGGHYLWLSDRDPAPKAYVTGADGVVEVAYPRFVVERLETGEISFLIDHPDYVRERPFRSVDPSPTPRAPWAQKLGYWMRRLRGQVHTTPEPVVLQRGAVVVTAGYCRNVGDWATPMLPDIPGLWGQSTNDWQEVTPGVWRCAKVPSGTQRLRLAHRDAAGGIWFSDEMTFQARAGETNSFQLPLVRGLDVRGQLEASVPRPVVDGRVMAEIAAAGGATEEPVVWTTWAPIQPDGRFVLTSLPPGQLEVLGLCAGFVSRNGDSNRTGLVRAPQRFQVGTNAAGLVLLMEPTARIEVTVLDDQRRPLQGAEVVLWPNVIWQNRGTTIFGQRFARSADRFGTDGPLARPEPSPAWLSLYRATSDERGQARVGLLPAHADTLAVHHPHFELPVRTTAWGPGARDLPVALSPGQTTRITVVLQRRGADRLEH